LNGFLLRWVLHPPDEDSMSALRVRGRGEVLLAAGCKDEPPSMPDSTQMRAGVQHSVPMQAASEFSSTSSGRSWPQFHVQKLPFMRIIRPVRRCTSPHRFLCAYP
jgi:hypothetical protein